MTTLDERQTTKVSRSRLRVALYGALALTLCATLGLSAGVAEGKKRKARAGGTVDITKVVGAPIPDAVGPSGGTVTSTIDVAGKRFKGARIRDVNATVQITGTSPPAIGDLAAMLTAPIGTSTFLFFTGLGPGNQIGPLTLDDESLPFLSAGAPVDPTSLYAPYQGTAQPDGFPLAIMDNGPATGTWTLTVTDFLPDDTSVLNSWQLHVIAGRPYRRK